MSIMRMPDSVRILRLTDKSSHTTMGSSGLQVCKYESQNRRLAGTVLTSLV